MSKESDTGLGTVQFTLGLVTINLYLRCVSITVFVCYCFNSTLSGYSNEAGLVAYIKSYHRHVWRFCSIPVKLFCDGACTVKLYEYPRRSAENHKIYESVTSSWQSSLFSLQYNYKRMSMYSVFHVLITYRWIFSITRERWFPESRTFQPG